MKKVLSLELAASLMPSGGAFKGDGKSSISERVFSDCVSALKDTLACLDRGTMQKTASAITHAESLYLFGAGGSAHIAQEAALKFRLLGFRSISFVDPIQQLAAARTVTPKDVAIAVTYSGNQPEVGQALHIAKERQAFCVCITSFEQSLVAKSADALLLISIPSETFRGQTGAHRVAQIAIHSRFGREILEVVIVRQNGEKKPAKNLECSAQYERNLIGGGLYYDGESLR